MAILKNRVGVVTSTTGTVTVALGAAIPFGVPPHAAKWQTFTQGGIVNGNVVRYLILDGAEWEYGLGTYIAAGNQMSRASGAMDGTVAGQKSSTGGLLALSGNAQVFVAAIAEDIDSSLFAPLASPVFTGDPRITTTPAPGDNDTSIASTAFVQGEIAAKASEVGQCYLLTPTNPNFLTLVPRNGNLLVINGVPRVVPNAGVTVNATGNSANTFYYIYASWTGSAIVLEFSTTTYVDTVWGIKVKSGDVTRTLVGICSAGASNSTWSLNINETASLFNPKRKWAAGGGGINPSTGSTTPVEMSTSLRIPFISFSDRLVRMTINGSVRMDTSTYFWNMSLDGVTAPTLLQANMRVISTGTVTVWSLASCEASFFPTEARHFSTGLHYVAASTGFSENVSMGMETWG